MELREQFEDEKGYNCYAYRQDYAGGHQYEDGFNDDYVQWLEHKLASTPDLLEALIGLVNQIKNEHCSEYIDDLQENAKQAINKALNK